MRASTTAPCMGILLAGGLATATVVTDDATSATGKAFDFIIVGAGLSGLTVANKVFQITEMSIGTSLIGIIAQCKKLLHARN